MHRFILNPNRQSSTTDFPENYVMLRYDIHKLWDDHVFSILGSWVVHTLESALPEFETNFQNRQLQPLRGISVFHLFCRFALAIFDKSTFLLEKVNRWLVSLEEDDRLVGKSYTAGQYKGFLPSTRASSRSKSSRKRSQPDQATNDVDHPVGPSDDDNSHFDATQSWILSLEQTNDED